MRVQHKDATIENTDDTFPGAFRVVLSTASKDRDGDELRPDGWKMPLPEHITFDADHGMSVATTVGSGRPFLNEKDADGVLPVPEAPEGSLVVDGTYSSLPRAQEVRTLANEGHIRTTSVAFMTDKQQGKDGTSTPVRELLNGAFVAIPANPEAVVLSSKSVRSTKSGARNSRADQEKLQAAHDALVAVGAQCSASKSYEPESDDEDEGDAEPSTSSADESDTENPPPRRDDAHDEHGDEETETPDDDGEDEPPADDEADDEQDDDKALADENELRTRTLALMAEAASCE